MYSKTKQDINKLKSLGTRFTSASNDAERIKLYGEIVSVDATVFDALRKMMIYTATLNTSGLIGLELTLTKKLTFYQNIEHITRKSITSRQEV